MQKRRWFVSLSLLAALVGILLVGYAYLRVYRQAKLDRALVIAVKSADVSSVQSLLSQGANANTHETADPDLSFLHFVKRLLTRWQPDPFSEAISPSVFKILMENASTLQSSDRTHSDAIGEALVKHGAGSHFSLRSSETPLESAAELGMHKIVQSLLERGEKVNTPDEYGLYPIMYADAEGTEMLLKYGASPNSSTKEGETPLYFAAQRYEPGTDTVRVLLAAGANPNAKDKDGVTPLMLDGTPESAKLLIQYGVNVNARDKNGISVFGYAEQKYKVFTMEERAELHTLLKQHGAKR